MKKLQSEKFPKKDRQVWLRLTRLFFICRAEQTVAHCWEAYGVQEAIRGLSRLGRNLAASTVFFLSIFFLELPIEWPQRREKDYAGRGRRRWMGMGGVRGNSEGWTGTKWN